MGKHRSSNGNSSWAFWLIITVVAAVVLAAYLGVLGAALEILTGGTGIK